MPFLCSFFAFLFSFCCFAQYDLNEVGLGANVSFFNAFYNSTPVPVMQLDYKHEFYYKTKNFPHDRSVETRIGFSYSDFKPNSLYLVNIGLQNSYVNNEYLMAYGAEVVGFVFQSSRIPGKVLRVERGGTFGEGIGPGLFYKLGKRLNKYWSVNAEAGILVYSGNFYSWSTGELTWKCGYPSFGLYKTGVSVNYIFRTPQPPPY